MKIRHTFRLFVVAGCLFSFASLASAVPFIVKPVATPDYESEYLPDTRLAIDSANGNGLSFDLLTNDPVPGVFPTHDNNVTNMWLTAVPDNNTFIVYDLGAEYQLTGLYLWNYNESGSFTQRGIANTDILFSTESFSSGFGSAQNFVFGQATGSATDPGTSVSFSPTFARWVRFQINSNNGGDHTGIAEVRFIAEPPPAPEPSTVALLGIGMAAWAIRRRRARVA